MIKNLEKTISSSSGKDVLLVSDFNLGIVAKAIKDSAILLEKWWNDGEWSKNLDISILIKETFELDIKNNDLHCIMWENWMKFLADIELIDTEIRWEWPNRVWINQKDYDYLDSLIKKYS